MAPDRERGLKKLSEHLDKSFEGIPGVDEGWVRKVKRADCVQKMWKGVVAPVFLDHTNSVFIFTRDGKRQMHVYMDESIYAAELNNQREIIKLRFAERYGELIDEFHIHVSVGKYKRRHPFGKQRETACPAPRSLEPLDEDETQAVEKATGKIDDPRLRESFRQAMISDICWKKTEKR